MPRTEGEEKKAARAKKGRGKKEEEEEEDKGERGRAHRKPRHGGDLELDELRVSAGESSSLPPRSGGGDEESALPSATVHPEPLRFFFERRFLWSLSLLFCETVAGFLSWSLFSYYGYVIYVKLLTAVGIHPLAIVALGFFLPSPLLLFIPFVFDWCRKLRMLLRAVSILSVPLSLTVGDTVYGFSLVVCGAGIAVEMIIVALEVYQPRGGPAAGRRKEDGAALDADSAAADDAHEEARFRRFVWGRLLGWALYLTLRLAFLSLTPMEYHRGFAIVGILAGIGCAAWMTYADWRVPACSPVPLAALWPWWAEVPAAARPCSPDLQWGATAPYAGRLDLASARWHLSAVWAWVHALWCGAALGALLHHLFFFLSPFWVPKWVGLNATFGGAVGVVLAGVVPAVLLSASAFVLPWALLAYTVGLAFFSVGGLFGYGGGLLLGAALPAIFASLLLHLRLALATRAQVAVACITCSVSIVVWTFFRVATLFGGYVGMDALAGRLGLFLWLSLAVFAPLLGGLVAGFRRDVPWWPPRTALRRPPAEFLVVWGGVLATALLCVLVGVAQRRFDVVPPAGVEFSVMTYNIQQGVHPDGGLSLSSLAGFLDENRADLIGLQEGEGMRYFLGHRDIAEYLRVRLRLHKFDAHPGMEGVISAPVLGSYPLADCRAEQLDRELGGAGLVRPLVECHIAIAGQSVTLLNTHIEFSDPPDAQIQFARLAARANTSGPLLVVGDFNHSPNSSMVEWFLAAVPGLQFVTDVVNNTYATHDGGSKIDYIFFRGLRLLHVDHLLNKTLSISDHYPVRATFALPVAPRSGPATSPSSPGPATTTV